MKVFSFSFDAARPSPQAFYTAPYSDFGVALKVFKGGAALSGVSLSSEGAAFEAEEDSPGGFAMFRLSSDAPGGRVFTVGASGTSQTFELRQTTTDEASFWRDAGGGGGGGGGVSEEWVESRISGFVSGYGVSAVSACSLEDYALISAEADPSVLYVCR